MNTIIKLKYQCRWCDGSFESGTEYLENFVMSNRLHQMHFCNEKEHNFYPHIILLRCGVGDLVGYTVVRQE